MRSFIRFLGLCFASATMLISFGPVVVTAQEPAEDAAAEVAPTGDDVQGDRASDFRAVRGSETEDVPGGPLLLGAYIGMLVIFMLFLLRLARLIKATQQELEGLREDVLPPEEG